MRNIIYTVVYWIVALVLIALLLSSLSYSFSDALFIGILLLPGALVVRFVLPKVQIQRKGKVKNTVFFLLSVLVGEILLMMVGNYYLVFRRDEFIDIYSNVPKIPEIVLNPLFIIMLILVFNIGDYYLTVYFKKHKPKTSSKLTFISDRKNVTLLQDEIRYVESNDTEVWINATESRRFRNKTPISQWENLLGEGFMRVHRSYLVNVDYIDGAERDVVILGEDEIPVSRKYKDNVMQYLEEKNS